MSAVISVRVSDQEQEILTKVSAVYGCGVSSLMKKFVFEKLEDEYDLRVFEEYEKDKAAGNIKTYSHEEAWKELGL